MNLKNMLLLILMALFIITLPGIHMNSSNISYAKSGIPAFPGTEGGGSQSVGGRGGTIIEVTNLNDSVRGV
jgi:hypothetical protein